MDNSFFRRYMSSTQQLSGISAGRQVINRILHWPAGLIQLTGEEQEDAGLYLGISRMSNNVQRDE